MIKRFIKTCLLLLFASGIVLTVQSKVTYPTEDRKLWATFQIEYEISKNIDIEISEELRYFKNRSILEESLTDIGGNYRFTEYLKIGLFYRFRALVEDDLTQHEAYANFSLTRKYGIFTFADRIRFHNKYRKEKDNIYNLRNQISVSAEAAKWLEPYVSAEIFYRYMYDKGDRLSQARYKIGAKFEFLDFNEIELYFMREQEYNTNKAIHSNIIGISYCLNF